MRFFLFTVKPVKQIAIFLWFEFS